MPLIPPMTPSMPWPPIKKPAGTPPFLDLHRLGRDPSAEEIVENVVRIAVREMELLSPLPNYVLNKVYVKRQMIREKLNHH